MLDHTNVTKKLNRTKDKMTMVLLFALGTIDFFLCGKMIFTELCRSRQTCFSNYLEVINADPLSYCDTTAPWFNT